MSDTTQAIETLRQYAHSCHDEIAQAGARLVAAYAELERELKKADAETLHRARIDAEDMRRIQDAYEQLRLDRDDAHRAWKAAEAEVTRLRGRDNILAALERWYRADGRLDFPGAEAALLALCAETFGENSSESRGERA